MQTARLTVGLSSNYMTLQPTRPYSIYFIFFLLVFFLLLLVIVSPVYWEEHNVSTFSFMLIKMCLVKLTLPGCMACHPIQLLLSPI
jgi:hypothetical protein